MRSLTPSQRLALVTLVVCLAAFVGLRLVQADRSDDDMHVEVEADEEGRSALASARADVLYERSFPVQPGDRLAINLSSEDVIVEPLQGGPASVTVEGRGRDAEAEFERRRFSAEYGGGRLHVRTNPERRRGFGNVRAGFTVTVRVPASVSAAVNVASGDVRLGDLEGEVTVNASSGDVQAGDLVGGPVRVHTASGDVELRAVRADELAVATSSGDVEARRVEAAVSAQTGSGDVVIGFNDFRGLRATTGSGDVEVTLPRGTGAEVAINSGDIDIADALGFQGSAQRRSKHGRLGGGGPDLRVDTGSGSVSIHAR